MIIQAYTKGVQRKFLMEWGFGLCTSPFSPLHSKYDCIHHEYYNLGAQILLHGVQLRSWGTIRYRAELMSTKTIVLTLTFHFIVPFSAFRSIKN